MLKKHFWSFIILILLSGAACLFAQDLKTDQELYLRDPEPRFHGEQVKSLQRLLLFEGIDIGPDGIDGWFGRDTDAALRKYQEKIGAAVTGRIKVGVVLRELVWNPEITTPFDCSVEEEGPFANPEDDVEMFLYEGYELEFSSRYGTLTVPAYEIEGNYYSGFMLSPDKRFVAAMGYLSTGYYDTDSKVKVWDILTGGTFEFYAIEAFFDWQTGQHEQPFDEPQIMEFFWSREEPKPDSELRLVISAGSYHHEMGDVSRIVLLYPWRQAE
ncbi:MAG: peptidoglycan-binding protein [Spirochaetales bacterium]|nr:peptidoglycan-binding protein [Spirochaetales bacterium]